MSQIPESAKCAAVQAELGTYLDAELSPEQSRTVEQHLEFCSACRGVRLALELVRQAVRQLPRREPSAALRARLQAQLQQELHTPELSAPLSPQSGECAPPAPPLWGEAGQARSVLPPELEGQGNAVLGQRSATALRIIYRGSLRLPPLLPAPPGPKPAQTIRRLIVIRDSGTYRQLQTR